MAKKRFLMVSSHPQSLLHFRGHLIRAILRIGIEVHVAAPQMSRERHLTSIFESLGVVSHDLNLQRSGMNPISDIRTLFHFIYLFRRLKPHFYFGYTIKPVIYGVISAWLTGVPQKNVLISGLGYFFVDCERHFWLSRIVFLLYRFSLAKCDRVFFQNRDDEALFFSKRILKPSDRKTLVVDGSGVDTDFFSVVPFPDTVTFLMISRLIGDKGVREYATAATIVRRKYPWVKFNFVGGRDSNPSAISDVEVRDIFRDGGIAYYGQLNDVREVIAASSVYVLPSYREGTPRSVLEAMSMGRPIITTDAPGCRETVIDGKNGFLVPVKAVYPLAEAMIKFVESVDLIPKMGFYSRQIAVKRYNVHRVNSVILKGMGVV